MTSLTVQIVQLYAENVDGVINRKYERPSPVQLYATEAYLTCSRSVIAGEVLSNHLVL